MSNDKFRYGGAGSLGDLVRQGGDVYSNLRNENDIKNRGAGMWADLARNGGDVIADHDINDPSPGQTVSYLPTIATSPYYAYSLHKVISGYAGPVAKACASNDSATPAAGIDIYPNADGTPNFTAAVSTFGSSFHVYELYDQTGNHANCTQGTAANRARIVPDLIGGLQAWYGTSTGVSRFNLPATITTDRQNYGHLSVICGPNQIGSGSSINVIAFGTVASPNYLALMTGERGMMSLGSVFAQHYLPLHTGPTCCIWTGNASNSIMFRDGFKGTHTVQGALSGITGGYLGYQPSGTGSYEQRHYADIGYNATISDADAATLTTWSHGRFGSKTRTSQVWYDGASDIFGQNSTNFLNSHYALIGQLTGDPYVQNLGRPGVTAQAMVAVRSQAVMTGMYRSTYSKNLYVHRFGSNDIAAGRTLAQLQGDVQTLLTRAQTAGFTCLIEDVIKRVPFDATQEQTRQDYNNWLQAQQGALGFTRIPLMDLDGSLTLATDGLHPSSAEYAIIANMQKTYLNAALA